MKAESMSSILITRIRFFMFAVGFYIYVMFYAFVAMYFFFEFGTTFGYGIFLRGYDVLLPPSFEEFSAPLENSNLDSLEPKFDSPEGIKTQEETSTFYQKHKKIIFLLGMIAGKLVLKYYLGGIFPFSKL